MNNLSGQESLWVAFPLLVVVILLIAGLIVLPLAQTEIRSQASQPTQAVITPVVSPLQTETPEVICSDLYSPVCGVNGVTYPSECEASLNAVTGYTPGECQAKITPVSQPQNLRYTLPATN